MQVFRLMNMPDRVIAFDELPERLVQGFELCPATAFPRYWKEWMGKKKKVTVNPPEKDPLTGQVRRFDPIVEEDHYFYLVDWTLEPIVERWKEICAYVKQNIPKDFRLMEKIEDMAKPLSPNKTDGVTLEPEEVTVIPVPKENPELAGATGKESNVPQGTFKCGTEGCPAEFEKKQALVMHRMKKHSKEPVKV